MKFLGELILKRKKSKLKRKVYFKNLDHVKSTLILYDCTDSAKSQVVKSFIRYFKENRIQVDSIGYYSKVGKNVKKPEDEIDYFFYDKKELNPYKFTKSLKIKKLIAKQHDLMIDLNLDESFSLEVLSSLSKAKFKVGPNLKYGNDVFDLTIDIEKPKLEFLVEQIKYYIKMINK